MRQALLKLLPLLAPDGASASHTERVVSAVGGFIGILLVYLVSRMFFEAHSTALIVASMGASAVLLFAVPHGQLSQPWALIGGHTVSALIGITCYRWIPDPALSGACAVALAIGAMYYLRCLHPPGGATALTAVAGGNEIHALGYYFVVTPVLMNVAAILIAAVAVNYFFAWRRYPVALAARPRTHTAVTNNTDEVEGELTHSDLAYALRKLGSFVDVTEQDLATIYALASEHAHQAHLNPAEIKRGRAYSNGRYADQWAVRQVVDESSKGVGDKDLVIYKVVAGKGRRTSGLCTRAQFAQWARYEVVLNENSWQKAVRDPQFTQCVQDDN